MANKITSGNGTAAMPAFGPHWDTKQDKLSNKWAVSTADFEHARTQQDTGVQAGQHPGYDPDSTGTLLKSAVLWEENESLDPPLVILCNHLTLKLSMH